MSHKTEIIKSSTNISILYTSKINHKTKLVSVTTAVRKPFYLPSYSLCCKQNLIKRLLTWITSRQTSEQQLNSTEPWEIDTWAAQIGRYRLFHISESTQCRASVCTLSYCHNLLISDWNLGKRQFLFLSALICAELWISNKLTWHWHSLFLHVFHAEHQQN